jgi:predicted site-specific integrase-resolvase
MIETISTIDIIESALNDLNKINYNNKEETEKKVVNAKITLQTYRDKLQNEVNAFDEWAKTQSDIHTSLELEKEDK